MKGVVKLLIIDGLQLLLRENQMLRKKVHRLSIGQQVLLGSEHILLSLIADTLIGGELAAIVVLEGDVLIAGCFLLSSIRRLLLSALQAIQDVLELLLPEG